MLPTAVGRFLKGFRVEKFASFTFLNDFREVKPASFVSLKGANVPALFSDNLKYLCRALNLHFGSPFVHFEVEIGGIGGGF